MRCLLLVACVGCSFDPGATSAGVQDGPTITGDARSVDGSVVSPSDAKPIDAPAIVVRYVQGNVATDTGNVIMTTLGSNETGADLNIVGVSWADPTISISSISDSDGNTYVAIGAPIVLTDIGTLVLYEAIDIGQGVAHNTVSVMFSTFTSPILMVVEYSGLATSSPVDVTASNASATGTSIDSGAITTTQAHDLVVGIAATGGAVSAGSGYTLRPSATVDLIEDKEVTTIGSYDATA